MLGRRSRSESGNPTLSRQAGSTPPGTRTAMEDEAPAIVQLDPPTPDSPPKKLWERHYRSFLKRKVLVAVPSPQSVDMRPPAPPRLPLTINASVDIQSKTLPTLRASQQPKSNSPCSSNGGGESSVRGGKFFTHAFRHQAASFDADGNGSTRHRKVKSMPADDLDGTIRHGYEKAYSPANRRFQKVATMGSAPSFRDDTLNKSAPLLKPSGGVIDRAVSASELSIHSRNGLQSSINHISSPSSTMDKNNNRHSLTPLLKASAGQSIESALIQPSNSMQMSRHPIALEPTQPTSKKAMKKAFTEFHNSRETGVDADSAYLAGEDPALAFQSLAWVNHRGGKLSNATSLENLRKDSVSQSADTKCSSPVRLRLDTVEENVTIFKDMRVLKPFVGVDQWEQGKRYLIAPAALMSLPLQVLNKLSGGDEYLSPVQVAESPPPTSAFGKILLGECLLTYIGGQRKFVTNVQQWSSTILVLRQNYLLEYTSMADLRAMPRGYAHLQFASCHLHPDFTDALELHFYASPCARADKRVLMIRIIDERHNHSEVRNQWMKCLNRAASLSVADLYDHATDSPLGRGSYSSIYPARRKGPHTRSDDATPYDCALKIFDKNAFWRHVVKGRERADTIVRETSVQATLTAKRGHLDSFLQIRGFFETSDHVVLELELLEGADLFNFISSKGVLGERDAAYIVQDMLRSLEAMSRIGVAHRDIKPANVLMCKSKGDIPRVKVGDFGMATFVGVDGQVRGRCGTPGYVAPEVFTAGAHGGYGNKVDVFSVGVTLYVMLCGYEPFYGETDAELIEANKIARVEFPEEDWGTVSPLARDLVLHLMQPNPAERPTAAEALAHPWFVDHAIKEEEPLVGSLPPPAIELISRDACVIS